MSKKNTQAPEETKAPKADKLKFGNLDKDKKHDLSGLNVPADHYVVRHFSYLTTQDGGQIEDPTSNRFQVYDKHNFGRMSAQPVKDGSQGASQFNTLGMNVDVLHDPTK